MPQFTPEELDFISKNADAFSDAEITQAHSQVMQPTGQESRAKYWNAEKEAANLDLMKQPDKQRQLMSETPEENYKHNMLAKAQGGDTATQEALINRQMNAQNKLNVVGSLPQVTGMVPGLGGVGEYARQKIMGEDTNYGDIAKETALSSIPFMIPAAKKAVGGVGDLLAKARTMLGTGKKMEGVAKAVSTPSDILRTLEEERNAFKLSPEMEAQNEAYKKAGLEPLTAAQQQTKAFGEPTPAQITETMLKSRSPELYQQQVKQAESLKKLEDEFKSMGHPNPEIASQEVMEKIYGKGGLQETTGKKIGSMMQPIEDMPINPIKETKTITEVIPPKKQPVYSESQMMPEAQTTTKTENIERASQLDADISRVEGGILSKDKGMVNGYLEELRNAETYKDLSNLNTKIAQETANHEVGNAAKQALKEIKKTAKNAFISEMKRQGFVNPEETYELYAITKDLNNRGGVIAGVEALGHEKDLINKVTRTGGTVDEFKDAVTKLGSPELMTTIKENWLKELFEKPNWSSEWRKYKTKSDVTNKLLNPEDIKKIDMMSMYKQQAESTASKVVNPSRTGVLGFAQRTLERPVTGMIQYILGDEIKYNRALHNYKKLTGALKNENIITPGRVKANAAFQGIREANDIKNSEGEE